MNATKTFSNELISFDECMERVSKIDPKAKTARSRAEVIGVSENTYGTWKKRGHVPYQELVRLCVNKNVDLNWFFRGGSGEPRIIGSNELMYESPNNGASDITEEDIRDAMKCISAEIERAQLPWSDSVLEMLIRTYFNFRYNTGVDIKTVVRAVAESQVQ